MGSRLDGPRRTMRPGEMPSGMAKCDEGYRCDVCGADVRDITESDLYLRYVMGEVAPDKLHSARERHIRCNPAVAQFIVDPQFEPVLVTGPFGKQDLDPDYVQQQEQLVTRAWRRLQQIPNMGLSLLEYPLPEVLQLWERQPPRSPTSSDDCTSC